MIELTHTDTGKTFAFQDGPDVLTIGRAGSNHIPIDDLHVSALHAQIVTREEGYMFQDLNSTNGSAVQREDQKTVVDATRPTGFLLREGDRILLGSETEPVVLLVTRLVHVGSPTRTAETIVATHQMLSALEVGGRIESQGGTLLPFLALSERLSRASRPEEAYEAFSACAREVVAPVRTIGFVDKSMDPSGFAFQTGPDPLPPREAVLPPAEGEDLTVRTLASGQAAVWIPIRLDEDASPWALAIACVASPAPSDLDRLSLAAGLLAARLRQLYLVSQLQNARARLSAKNRYLREKAQSRATETLIGKSPAMSALAEQIKKVALSDATVLIAGASGSGKELVAREIHRLSPRHAEIFAAVNCGALVDTLLETELFGCKKGAFTGAHRDREGLFEVAHGGTLFLDEIGDMTPSLQVKLLRVLETHEVTPVGGTRPRRVDVRVLTATHRDLAEEVGASRFREDLYYRINVFPIQVPPLSSRREDIPLLARHFLELFARESGSSVHEISEAAMRVLAATEYPGNVRQLANVIQRAVLLAGDSQRIDPDHLSCAEPNGIGQAVRQARSGPLKEQLARVERVLIVQALEQNDGNRTHAAKQLGITRQALLGKLNRYEIR